MFCIENIRSMLSRRLILIITIYFNNNNKKHHHMKVMGWIKRCEAVCWRQAKKNKQIENTRKWHPSDIKYACVARSTCLCIVYTVCCVVYPVWLRMMLLNGTPRHDSIYSTYQSCRARCETCFHMFRVYYYFINNNNNIAFIYYYTYIHIHMYTDNI